MYLVRKRKPRVKHIWIGANTACKMWATGGLKQSKYHLVANHEVESLETCVMCQNNAKSKGNE